MKLEDQVVSLDLSKRLKELGVKQDSYFYWVDGKLASALNEPEVTRALMDEDECSAFTIAELGEMLPYDFRTGKHLSNEKEGYFCEPIPSGEVFISQSETDARCKMLIYLIENKLVKP